MSNTIYLIALSSLLLGQYRTSDEEYEFVPDTDRKVRLKHGDTYSTGKLDAEGNFQPFPNSVNLSGAFSGTHVHLNYIKGPTYEYRSGRLILGELDEKGNFIPKVDSKVIDFKDYRFEEKATRIKNLPGKFVKKKDKDVEKK